jgi:hypothetical protein
MGGLLVLDEEEFAAPELTTAERAAARAALAELRKMVMERTPPFDAIAAPTLASCTCLNGARLTASSA